MTADNGLFRNGDLQVVAFRLASAVVSRDDREAIELWLRKVAFRNSEWVNGLISSRRENVTYDLRLMALPGTSPRSGGKIRLYLLCRLEGHSEEEVRQFSRVTLDILHAQFADFEFLQVPALQVSSLLEPFPLNHTASITRRSGYEELDTLKTSHGMGHAGFTGDSRLGEAPRGTFHIFPFLPAGGPWDVLLRYLAVSRQPTCVSIRLRPTILREDEEDFLEEQIAICERFSQIQLGSAPEDVSGLRPTLRKQADLIQLYQQRMLFALKDNACLMSINVASTEPLSPQLLDLVGSIVTRPGGGWRDQGTEPFHLYLAGGYVVHDASGDLESQEAFHRIEMRMADAAGLPASSRLLHLFDATEASAAFRIPPVVELDTPGIATRVWRVRPLPPGSAETGLFLGINRQRGDALPVYASADDRRRHAYVVGQTGTGKTTLLRSMIVNDIRAGEGVCVVDPHGDLFADILARIPEKRINDVVIIDPTDEEFPVGINLLECRTQAERYFVAQELVGIFSRLLTDEYGAASLTEFAGPVFFQQIRMNLLLLMSKVSLPGTLVDFYTLYQSSNHWRKWTPPDNPDPMLRRWVNDVLPKLDNLKQGVDSISMGMYVGSKFENLVFDPRLRNIFGQRHSTVDLRKICDERKILLINLAKGILTERNSTFLGMILLAKLIATVLERANVPEPQRTPFHLYVDEFQSMATEGFITLLSEARKFGLSLVLANQFLSQVANRRIVNAIFGNVGTIVSFRVGHEDAKLLEPQFLPDVVGGDLSRLPNRVAYVRTLFNGDAARPFTIETTVKDSVPSAEVAERTRAFSRRNYARPRAEVDAAIS